MIAATLTISPLIELQLRPQAGGDETVYLLDFWYEPSPGGRSELARDVVIIFDQDRLRAAYVDYNQYGEELAAMLFADSRLREAWIRARAAADATDQPLRLLLNLEARSPVLNSIRWELLRDPAHGEFIFLSERILAVRHLTSVDLAPVVPRPAAELRAVAVIASPGDLSKYRMAPIDVEGEVSRTRTALGSVPLRVLASGTSAKPTITALMNALRDGCDILYILAHSANRDEQPVFFLEDELGEVALITGAEIARLIATLQRRPLLAILSSCQSAGISDEIESAAAAPWFASAGIPAIVAMQGMISTETIAAFMPMFFVELRRDGRIDRAMAAARGAVSDRADWWVIVLFTRIRDSRLWGSSSELETADGSMTRGPSLTTPPAGTVAGATPTEVGGSNTRPISGTANVILAEAHLQAEGGLQAEGSVVVAPGAASASVEAVGPSAVLTSSSSEGKDKSAEQGSDSTQVEEPLELGARRGAFNDEVAKEDQLDVGSYIIAFADLVESRDTAPPLTIGIYGSWGMGKSFILEGIASELEARAAKRPKMRRKQAADSKQPAVNAVHIIRFNAWAYSASEVVWPGLVRAIMDQLEKVVFWNFFGLFGYKFRRNLTRNLRRRAGQVFVITALILLVAAAAFWSVGFNPQLFFGALITLGFAGLSKVVIDTLSDPLSKWVGTLFEEEEYGKKIGYMSQIRDDLSELEKRLRARDSRVLVIIDDLDRCEPDKAVAVLQAIKLLLNFDSFIVCMGIDARIITRAIEKHYEELLGEAGASGYEYLDKIVQIPFQIPRPSPEVIKTFLGRQMGVAFDATLTVPLVVSSSTVSAPTVLSADLPRFNSDARPEGQTENEKQPVERPAFTLTEHQAFAAIASELRPNPRHLKRLINVYRLVRTLAQYRSDLAVLRNPIATVRWLVISAQWPCTAYGMLWELDRILDEAADRGRQVVFPSEPALACLYARACTNLARHTRWSELRDKLDDDPEELVRLMGRPGARIQWEDLVSIRRYTIHFNPAVETELRLTGTTDASSEVQDQPATNGSVASKAQEPEQRV